ncbi:hypothetical protein [Bacillus paranthracis]|uniref:hypothetical protein n=1 Tax=Bacillus paranthracis TaxID=2026186 RepID=UPI003BFA77B2
MIRNPTSYFRVCFEKLDLPRGTHKVEVIAYGFAAGSLDSDTGTMISAIDYADFSTKVGDVLKEQEPGWSRFDDRSSAIRYEGSWTSYTNQSNGYLNSQHIKNNEQDKLGHVFFNFTGTKLRILAYRADSAYFKNTKIVIDGVTYDIPQINTPSSAITVLVFEKTDLNPGTHTVHMYDYILNLDAIDVGQGERILAQAKVGDVLKEPEPGWKRFDDSDPLISYAGPINASVNTSLDNYNKTLHVKDYRNSTAAEFKFTFKGTGIRIIATLSDVPEFKVESTIAIDGASETFNGYHLPYTIQGLAFQKLNLQDGVHTVKVSTPAFIFDAVDIQNGELISQDVITKPKVSLYEKESGKIFVDDFESVNPNWLMSPSNAFNNAVKKGFLRMNHADNKDVMLLIDKPQSNFAIQVIADYAPTKEEDQGGLLIYQNEKNKVEFLESYSANSSQSNKEWMAICKEDQWDFYTKTDTFFDYADNDSLAAKRIGVVLKRGTAEGFVPLDINKIIMTTSNMLRLRQLYGNYKVVLKDAVGNTLSSNIVATAHTGIDILLPSLEFEGIIEIYDEENELLAKKQATFYGGDMYCMGSSLQIKMDSNELNTTDPTNLGYMVNNERIVKMTIVNDNIGAATNIKLSIQQYMENVGYTWALISLEGTNYSNEIQIDSVAAQDTRDFWVKVVKDTNFLAFEPIYFNIHLKHN